MAGLCLYHAVAKYCPVFCDATGIIVAISSDCVINSTVCSSRVMTSAKNNCNKVSRKICISVKHLTIKQSPFVQVSKEAVLICYVLLFLTCEFYNFKGVEIRIIQLFIFKSSWNEHLFAANPFDLYFDQKMEKLQVKRIRKLPQFSRHGYQCPLLSGHGMFCTGL